MKKITIGVVAIVFLFSVNYAIAANGSNGQPFQDLWDEIASIWTAVDDLEVTPGEDGTDGADGLNCWDLDGDGVEDSEEDVNGDTFVNVLDCIVEQGEPGEGGTGSQGPQGDTGPAGLSYHLLDDNDQDLGIIIGTDDSSGSSYVTYLPSENISVTIIQLDSDVVTLGPGVSQIYYTQTDCLGTPYGGSGYTPGTLLLGNDQFGFRFFKYIPGPSGEPYLSTFFNAACHNNPNNIFALPLEEIPLPFTFPIAQPLKIVPS